MEIGYNQGNTMVERAGVTFDLDIQIEKNVSILDDTI